MELPNHKSKPSTFQNSHHLAYSGVEELFDNEAMLTKYNNDVVGLLSRGCGLNPKVLEFGAGIGTLAQIWFREQSVKPECVEIDPQLRTVLRNRNFVCVEPLLESSKRYDWVYSSNVLEHIENDVDVLKMIRSIMNPSATFAIYVPAFQGIYSPLDQKLGHYRRYGKSELQAKLRSAGFEVLSCEYVDSIGFFAWFAVKLLHKLGRTKGNSQASLRFYDRWVFPMSRFFDRIGFKWVLGKNLCVMARPVAP
jgi:SAM-dependent methyltransferase